MRRRLLLLASVALLAISLIPIASAGNGNVDFRAPLSHAQEVPTPEGAPGAGGTATFWVDGETVHYRITVRHLSTRPFMAHIHAPAGRHVATGIAVWLCGTEINPGPPGTPTCNNVQTGELVTGSFEGVLPEMENGLAYVNVHTTQNPPGEVRGQILQVGKR